MQYPSAWNVLVDNASEAFPVHAESLAATAQGVKPCPTDLGPKANQTSQVCGYRKVAKVSLHHAVQPSTDNRNQFTPAL